MKDSLNQQLQTLTGIPEMGTRLTMAVVISFALIVVIVLLYFKMIESDKNAGI